jgi:N utilization substance protein B
VNGPARRRSDGPDLGGSARATRPRRGTSARRHARELAFRVVYQGGLTGDGYAATWAAVCAEGSLSDDQRELVEDVVKLLESRAAEVDAAIAAACAHWPLERLAATDRSVLRSAVAELMARPGMPARVVLDEAIEIARRYGSDESGGFVNGVLDQVARRLRPGEM